MGWPWKFVSLNEDEVSLRRQTLDRYAGFAQLSAFVPVLLFLGYRLVSWVYGAVEAKKGAYNAIPESPLRKVRRQGPLGAWESRYRHLQWWLGDDVVFLGRTWGQRDEWVFGLAWGFWMVVLTVSGTGDGEDANISEAQTRRPLTRIRLPPSHKTSWCHRNISTASSVPPGAQEPQPGCLHIQLVT